MTLISVDEQVWKMAFSFTWIKKNEITNGLSPTATRWLLHFPLAPTIIGFFDSIMYEIDILFISFLFLSSVILLHAPFNYDEHRDYDTQWGQEAET